MTSIKIKGSAGQGIKFLSNILAKLFEKNNYEVAVINNYSPFIRYGDSDAKIIFSKDKIENPVAEEFDFEYDMTNEKLKEELEAERIGDEKINITLLRKIISDVNLEVSEKEIEELVGKRK
jgi:RNA recognition motif-containing protein